MSVPTYSALEILRASVIEDAKCGGSEFWVAPTMEKPITMRGQDEVGQWMLTIYPDVIELAVRPGDNDRWSAPMRFKREE